MNKIFSLILFICLTFTAKAQELSMGKWETFLSYYQTNSIAFDGSIAYCGTFSGLFSYNTTSGEFIKYDKTDGFNGTGVQALGYSNSADALMIVYDDANIDLLKGDRIINMPTFKLSNRYSKNSE